MSATPEATMIGSLVSGRGSTSGQGQRSNRPRGSHGRQVGTQTTSNNRGTFKGSTEGMTVNVCKLKSHAYRLGSRVLYAKWHRIFIAMYDNFWIKTMIKVSCNYDDLLIFYQP